MKQTRTVRQSIVVSAVLLSVLFFLPLAVIEPFRAELFGRETPVEESEPEVGKLDGEVMLQVLNGDMVEEMNLGTYLMGVVRSEMPASFEEEALKAQAVAARTYTLYKIPPISVRIPPAARRGFRSRVHGKTGEIRRIPMPKRSKRQCGIPMGR